MSSLSKKIEVYLKRLLDGSEAIEVQRSELADAFSCVPSQINYVLSTRFTPAQGYLVESRRGGGGYLRIVKLTWSNQAGNDLKAIYSNLGLEIEQSHAEGVLARLIDENFITEREYHMLKAVINRDVLQIELPERDKVRARILQAALTALCRNDI